MPPRPPRDPATVGSFAELRSHYRQLWVELDDCRHSKGMTSEALRYRTVEVRGAKADAKAAKSKLVTLSKHQKAKDEANKAGYWSGAAAITVTIFYEAFKVVGFPRRQGLGRVVGPRSGIRSDCMDGDNGIWLGIPCDA